MMQSDKFSLEEMGRRIYKRRKKLDLTQEELAEIAETTPQSISYAELGKRAMRPENLLNISAALGVSTDYLLTGNIVDEDLILLSDKLRSLTPAQFRLIENIIDDCNSLLSGE